MSTRTRTAVTTSTENTVTFVQNQLFRGFITITNEADASPRWLLDNRVRLEDALSTWLAEQSLAKIKLEICDENHNTLDAYVFDVSYDVDQGYVEFPVQEVCNTVDSYSHIDNAYTYINPITISSKRSEDFGYHFTDEDNYKTLSLGSFGANHIDVEVGKVVSGKGTTNNGEVSILTATAIIAFSGAAGGLAFMLLIAVFVAMPSAIISAIFGSSIFLDGFKVYMLFMISMLVLSYYQNTLSGIGWFALLPITIFLLIIGTISPVSYVSPFGFQNASLWAAFFVAISIIWLELE